MEFPVFALVVVFTIVGIWIAIDRVLRKPESELSSLDRMLAHLLLGRFFRSLRARFHKSRDDAGGER